MKKIYLIMMILCINSMYAQVGINNENPSSTLDVVAGSENTSNEIEGVLIPRVSINKALLMGQNTTTPLEESTVVYVNDLSDYTAPADGADAIVASITENGFYHWNGSVWIKHLTSDEGSKWKNDPSNTIVSLKNLSDGVTTRKDSANIIIKDKGFVGIGTIYPREKLHVDGNIFFGEKWKPETSETNEYIDSYNGGVAFRYVFPPNKYNSGRGGNYFLAGAGPNNNIIPNYRYGLAIGPLALRNSNEGDHNIAIGGNSLYSMIKGDRNIVIGHQAVRMILNAERNVVIGDYAGYSPNANLVDYFKNNVVVGSNAMKFNKGEKNIAIGSEAMRFNSSGDNNVIIGYQIPLPYEQNGNNQLSINNWITGLDGRIGIGPKYVSTYDLANIANPTILEQATITERLEVDGNIKVGGTGAAITDGAACTNNGTISYAANGYFYGCTGDNVWKKLHN